MNNTANGIVTTLELIIRNGKNEPIDRLGSYIVGAILARDDSDELVKVYPLHAEIAELGAELETTSFNRYQNDIFDLIKAKIEHLKTDLKL